MGHGLWSQILCIWESFAFAFEGELIIECRIKGNGRWVGVRGEGGLRPPFWKKKLGAGRPSAAPREEHKKKPARKCRANNPTAPVSPRPARVARGAPGSRTIVRPVPYAWFGFPTKTHPTRQNPPKVTETGPNSTRNRPNPPKLSQTWPEPVEKHGLDVF